MQYNKGFIISNPKKLVLVQFPAVVNDVGKALKMLGGIKSVETAICNERRNLELRFSPENFYNKGTIAERDNKPFVIIKVVIKKIVIKGKVIKVNVVDYELFGITAINFRFNRLCDFQYLPLQPKEEVEVEEDLDYIYDKLMPNKLPEVGWINDESTKNMPIFLPPTIFSNKVMYSNNQLYFDRSKFYEGRFTAEYYNKFKEQELQQKLYREEKEKTVYPRLAFFCNFDDEIPTGPSQAALKVLSSKYTCPTSLETIKQFFEKRPIWSKTALLYRTKVRLEQLKHILPTIGYYFVTGPWRTMWVKYGYDPRKDPSSRIYQTFDYRVTSKGGFSLAIKPRRYVNSHQVYLNKDAEKFSLNEKVQAKSKNQGLEENSFVLKPGYLPGARQMFYQYCDLKLPEIEAMVARLPPVLPGTTCDKKLGWLPNRFPEQCREIVSRYTKETISKEVEKNKRLQEAETNAARNESVVEEEDEERDKDYELYEISDSSDSSCSEDESEDKTLNEKEDSDAEIDYEVVEDINKLLGTTIPTSTSPKPGPSGINLKKT